MKAVARSSRGKDSLIFTLFLCVSYVFWLLLTLNDEVQEDIDIRFEITGVPTGTTIISEVPEVISASIRDKGTTLARFVWGNPPSLKIKFSELSRSDDNERLVMSDAELSGRLRNIFGPAGRIQSVKPDSLSLYFTERPGRKIAVKLDIEAKPSLQSVISGPITVSPDSVTVYSVKRLPSRTKSISTVRLSLSDLTDTACVEAELTAIPHARMVPDRVKVSIPVEPLIAKRRTIPVKVIGVPQGFDMYTFPANVTISFLVPMSYYSLDDTGGFAVVDYSSGRHDRQSQAKLPVKLMNLPEYYHNISAETDSVEYLISPKGE